MARDRNDTHEGDDEVPPSKMKSKYKSRESSHSESERSDEDSDSESEYSSSSSEYSESESQPESESEEEKRRRKRKERKRRREKEEERERKRRKREKEKRKREKEKKEKRKKKKKEKLERGKRGAVTNSWGKYGIIRETDMWNKRPEFTAWLAEVRQGLGKQLQRGDVNLESLPNWEEKQMFKQFMEDHNTATFPSKKYYNLDAYHKRQMEKEFMKGFKKVSQKERTIFNDEEQRRLELQQAREKQKEEEVEALKRSMQSGMAQAMKEQAQLREEMAYQYKLGNFEAAAAIQRRLDPDVAM
ncbi:hypothetical protein Patl1_04617 [Pistacia atlantica]|uniref:Uncharacterized protein n=1 Tax=Pistacia atlantica TaxID=434234 RepID=A0ACC1BV77_9ROSI|nr:hypothetical protein Patl1_04617 [Pistacia atlantica]